MHDSWNGFITQLLVLLFLGCLVQNASKAGQGTLGAPPLSLQRKVQCVQAQVQKWQQEGKDPQPIVDIMQGIPRLIDEQKFAKAEKLVDRALESRRRGVSGCRDVSGGSPALSSSRPAAFTSTKSGLFPSDCREMAAGGEGSAAPWRYHAGLSGLDGTREARGGGAGGGPGTESLGRGVPETRGRGNGSRPKQTSQIKHHHPARRQVQQRSIPHPREAGSGAIPF